jgi:hypothetical protein
MLGSAATSTRRLASLNDVTDKKPESLSLQRGSNLETPKQPSRAASMIATSSGEADAAQRRNEREAADIRAGAALIPMREHTEAARPFDPAATAALDNFLRTGDEATTNGRPMPEGPQGPEEADVEHPGTLAELVKRDIEPIRFVIEGLVPEGLTLLAGKPKLGKSWLALMLSLCVCSGRDVLGHATMPSEVAYIALEDGERRLQDRVHKLGGHKYGEALRRFHYRTAWPVLSHGGLEQLEQWMIDHPDTRLIVIDTLGKIRGDLPGRDMFSEEYKLYGRLQTFASNHRVALLLIHHLRKQGADDWLEQTSGSQAITAAADTILGLFRERGQMDATLRLASREVPERDIALRFDGGVWSSLGDAAKYRLTVERSQILEALTELGGEAKVAEIADHVGKEPANTSKLLGKLADVGAVHKVAWAVYALTPPVEVGAPVETQSTVSTTSTNQEDQRKSANTNSPDARKEIQ